MLLLLLLLADVDAAVVGLVVVADIVAVGVAVVVVVDVCFLVVFLLLTPAINNNIQMTIPNIYLYRDRNHAGS